MGLKTLYSFFFFNHIFILHFQRYKPNVSAVELWKTRVAYTLSVQSRAPQQREQDWQKRFRRRLKPLSTSSIVVCKRLEHEWPHLKHNEVLGRVVAEMENSDRSQMWRLTRLRHKNGKQIASCSEEMRVKRRENEKGLFILHTLFRGCCLSICVFLGEQ